MAGLCARLAVSAQRRGPRLLRQPAYINPFWNISHKGFHTSSRMTEKQVEELKKNPYFDKYADKISKLQKTSPEEFLSRLAAHEERKNAPAPEQKDFSLPGKARVATNVNPATKSLDKIVKLDLLKDKSAEEITEIWTSYYAKKDAICAVIPAETYRTMKKRFQQYNTFLFPIPRKNGYEFVMVQFQGDEAHFTTLINFQAHKENAPECLSLTHFTELLDDKGIVLMAGEYDKDSLELMEAKCLADQVSIYYSRPSPAQQQILDNFKSNPAFFDHNQLIAEMNSLSL